MFVIKQSDEYTWPVTVEIPTDRGRYQKQRFQARFARVSQERIDQLLKEVNAGRYDGAEGDQALIDEILLGWSGIQTEDGEDYPYTDANRDALLASIAGLRAAIIGAFFESVNGGAKRKNS